MKTKRFTSLVDRLHTFCKFFPVYFEMHECTRGVKSTLATGQANCVVFSETWVFFTKCVFAILEELLYNRFIDVLQHAQQESFSQIILLECDLVLLYPGKQSSYDTIIILR